jgi:hypothetical protein
MLLKLAPLILLLSLNTQADLIAHEWGTFTSLMGSNGVRQNGMYHEDELLPDFVHRFGEDFKIELPNSNTVALNGCNHHNKACDWLLTGQVISQKMETPVLYFYSDKDTEVNATMDVGFPEGIISESYPKAQANYPLAAIGTQLKNGYSHYAFTILPKANPSSLIDVPKENIYSHARNVSSNLLKSNDEVEKFIFYRGVGHFKTDLEVTSKNDSLNFLNKGELISHVYLLNSNGSTGDIIDLGQLEANVQLGVSDKLVNQLKSTHLSQQDFIKKSRSLIIKSLVENGLYSDEATAMLDTWEQSYLKNNGLRVLYILNRSEVEKILPMNIAPMPKTLNRVFIGRIEVLTEKEENKLFNDVLKSKDMFQIEKLGRMAHPIANRLLEMAIAKKVSSIELNIFKNLVKKAL